MCIRDRLRFGGKAASVSRKPGFEFVYADFANQDFILSRNTEIHGKAVVEHIRYRLLVTLRAKGLRVIGSSD